MRGTDATRMGVRGSRRQKSVTTFGLVGRVLWTTGGLTVLYLLLSPIVHLLRGGLINAGIGAIVPLFLAVAGVILLVWVWPRFVRDVWQPASLPGDELTDLRDQARLESALRKRAETQSDRQPLSERTAPTRW
jgi:hypothetical protein